MQEMCKNTRVKVIIFTLITLLGVILDRITKNLCVSSLELGEGVSIIPKVLNFTYIQNKGASFGLLANARWIFMIASGVLIVAVTVYIFKAKSLSTFDLITLSMILSGGIGNMIDRVFYGYVVDFIDVICVPGWGWIFNVADALVCVGASLFIISNIVREIKNRKGKKDNVDNEA